MSPEPRKSLRPGHYDWWICQACGAKHGWRPAVCQQCARPDLRRQSHVASVSEPGATSSAAATVTRSGVGRRTRKAESQDPGAVSNPGAVSETGGDRPTPKGESQDLEAVTSADPDPVPETGVQVPACDRGYYGGKGGCFRQLVNQIPPHDALVIPFAGHCAIVRNLQLPPTVWLNDLDPAVIDWWAERVRHLEAASRITVTQHCGIELLWSLIPESSATDSVYRDTGPLNNRLFVYIDPPYLKSTLRSESRYRCNLTDAQHRELLHVANNLRCKVMISGYWSDLYADKLRLWRHIEFQSMTRRGPRMESAWCNYLEPTELQDYRYLGSTKRVRFKLLRRRQNLLGKLRRLPDVERNALLAAVSSEYGVPAAPARASRDSETEYSR